MNPIAAVKFCPLRSPRLFLGEPIHDVTTERPVVFYSVAATRFDVAAKPLSVWERLYANAAARKAALLAVLALIWEVYARWLANPLLFPTFTSTVYAL